MPYGAIAAGAGALGSIAGGILASGEAERRRKRLEQIANTPGLDLAGVGQESLNAVLTNADLSGEVTNRLTMNDQATLDQLLEQSMPGYQGRQLSQADIIDQWLAGEVPQDVTDQVVRSGAAKALEGGYGDSKAGRNLVARDLGLTTLDLQRMGLGAAGDFARTSRSVGITNPVSSERWAGATPTEAIALRSSERTQRINALLGAATAPTGTEVIAGMLANLGKNATAVGMSGILDGKG